MGGEPGEEDPMSIVGRRYYKMHWARYHRGLPVWKPVYVWAETKEEASKLGWEMLGRLRDAKAQR